MYIQSLKLQDYRNYAQLALTFSPGLNVVFGDNAQGKTNLLESIYFLATGRSHRTSRDAELVREGSPSLFIQATVQRKTGALSLELAFGQETRKQLKINGIAERRITKLVGNAAAVFFSPDDLQLVKGAPAGRRRFLDVELSQISQTYLHHLVTYNRTLSQRNVLLKQEALDEALLSIYDEQLVEAGSQIIARRAQAVAELARIAAEYHSSLAQGKESLVVEYESQGVQPNEPTSAEAVAQRLRATMHARRREELRRQVTFVGPHRDDLIFRINGYDARQYGSQGQQRTAVLSLKLAELAFMAAELKEYPILLLDDVGSELDPHRRHYLLHAVQEQIQTFVSCTDLEDLMVRTWPSEHKLFRVQSGSVEWDTRGLS